MDRNAILERVTEIFQDILDDESITLTDSTTAADIADWDSLSHINIILAIEKGFGFKFAMGEVTGMKNVGEMLNIIMERASQ